MKINAPDLVLKIIKNIKENFSELLKDNLVGIYIHGSLAMGCFNPKSSYIDLLLVVKNSLSLKTKRGLGKIILNIIENNPQKLDLSVILLKTLNKFVYPTPFEFQFSEAPRQ